MLLSDLSPVAQDYVKSIWRLGELAGHPVTTKMLARRLRVSTSTVSETVSRLAKQGLVNHEAYGAIELSDVGHRLALAMVRRHRLVESFLVSELGYSWDEVHGEAEVLEHAVSDLLIDRIDARLGHPERDPHGDPIPSPTGSLPSVPARRLSELEEGEAGTVLRINDDDSDMLRYFASMGLGINSTCVVLERRDYAGVVLIRTAKNTEGIHLGTVAANSVWVTP